MSIHRIVIADDHGPFREALKLALSQRPDFKVVGEASNGEELLRQLRHEGKPEVVIVDISMPRIGGIEAIREVRKEDPDIKLLVLTMHRDEALLAEVIRAGADAYLLKEDVARELFDALDTVLDARVYVASSFLTGLKQAWLKSFIAAAEAQLGETAPTRQEKFLALFNARDCRMPDGKPL